MIGDKILTNRFSGTVIFILIIAAIFYLTFGSLGSTLSNLMQNALDGFSCFLADTLTKSHVSPFIQRLVVEGICPGVSSVLSFVPVIAVLFFCLSFLEETGYLSYASALMDKPFRKIGLSGEAAVSMLMGFGCSVPAILSASGMQNERIRRVTVMLIPYMSCSARLPIYIMFADNFFPENRMPFIAAMYIIGILTTVCGALCAKCRTHSTENRQQNAKYRAHLTKSCAQCTKCRTPKTIYRTPSRMIPSLRRISRVVCETSLAFVRKAFTVILLTSVIIWLLENLNFHFQPVYLTEDSMLAELGHLAAPVFAPLGFGCWQAAAAVIAGLSAKESVVSTLTVLTYPADTSPLHSGFSSGVSNTALLNEIFTPASAFSFCVFCLLYVPCIATLAAVSSKFNKKAALVMFVSQCCVAWIMSFLCYNFIRIFIY